KLNGLVEHPNDQCKIKNFTAEVSYNCAMIWNAYLGLLPPKLRGELMRTKVEGNHTRVLTFGSSLPVHRRVEEAVMAFTMDGGVDIDRFENIEFLGPYAVPTARIYKDIILGLKLHDGKLHVIWLQGAPKGFDEKVYDLAPTPPPPTSN